MGYRRPESVLVLVYTESGEVLLLKRTRPQLFWQSVTGTLETGEAPVEAAHRELAEETGICGASVIDCKQSNQFVISEAWRDRYAPGVTMNTEHIFCCPLADKPAKVCLAADEHSEFVWLPVDKAIEQVSSWTNRQALERYVASL